FFRVEDSGACWRRHWRPCNGDHRLRAEWARKDGIRLPGTTIRVPLDHFPRANGWFVAERAWSSGRLLLSPPIQEADGLGKRLPRPANRRKPTMAACNYCSIGGRIRTF